MQWTHRESHPDLQRAELASSCWTMSPIATLSGRRGTRTPKRLAPPPVFKTGSSSGRMPSVCKLRRQESNLRHDGSEPPARTSTGPTASVVRDTIKSRQARGEGFEPPLPGSKPGGLPLADPRFPRSALWESNPPRQLGRLEPLPLGQGHLLKAEGVRVELTRLLRSTAFEAAAIASWLAFP